MEVWNAWSCQDLNDSERQKVLEVFGRQATQIGNWLQMVDEVKSLHRCEMERRYQETIKPGDEEQFSYPGFPDIREEIDFSILSFSKALNMTLLVFTQNVNFRASVFSNVVYLLHSNFEKSVTFSGVKFFDKFSMQNVKIATDVVFGDAWFEENAYFIGVYVGAATYFQSVTFAGDVTFERNQFVGPVRFPNVNFGVRGAAKICAPNFTDTVFNKQVSFYNADFVNYFPVLSGTLFYDEVIFSAILISLN